MIIQPEKGTRNVNDVFYKAEKSRIDLLNREFFQNVELTKSENKLLVWLCGLDSWTINMLVSVLRKVSIEGVMNVKTEKTEQTSTLDKLKVFQQKINEQDKGAEQTKRCDIQRNQ